MNEITEISLQKNNKDRLNVSVNGSFAFGVEYATAVKFGLKVGRTLTDDEIAAISIEEGKTAAFDRGLKYAVKKTVSEKQMVEYLSRHGFNEEAVHAAMDKLKEYGYVDDVKFANAYVATYSAERGKNRLKLELKSAGVDPEIAEEILSRVDDEDSCDKCLDKYLRTHREPDRQKLINYLMYRGFDWDCINEAMNRRELWKDL